MRILLASLLVASPALAQLQFVDIAAESGLDLDSFGRATAMVDLDGDGLLDLIGANDGMENHFFRQKLDHTFELANASWGIAFDDRMSWGVLATDFDNDGDPDVYFANGAFGPPQPNQLLQNNIETTGVFVDVSEQSGMNAIVSRTFGTCALDFDRDGDLDIFLSNVYDTCQLLRNDDGIFVDVSAPAGITHLSSYRHCGAGDYDNDGWIDVVVGSKIGRNRLYRNLRDGTFDERGVQAGVAPTPADSFGLIFQDFDNDGWLDLFDAKYYGDPDPGETSRMYVNQGDGTFLDVTSSLTFTGQTDMGHDAGDLDADGHPDIFIGTGNPDFINLDHVFLITTDASGNLVSTDASDSSGITSIGKTRNHGMAFGDFDEDGDVDVFNNLGGIHLLPETNLDGYALWENQGNANAWLQLEIEGVLSNRDGVGARCKAVMASGREIHLHQAVGRGFSNTPSPILHFGLRDETEVDRLVVVWPSGIEQMRLLPPAFSRVTMVETGLVLRDPPVTGTTVTLVSVGEAGYETMIAFSSSTAWIPIPEAGGILQLGDPIMVLGTYTLDGNGLNEILVAIPDAPSLVGSTLYVQGWTHPAGLTTGGTLTNLVPIAFQ